MNEIDERIVNEILKPAGVWPISEVLQRRISKCEIDFDAFLVLKNKDFDYLGFNLGPKRKIQNQVKAIKTGVLESELFTSDDEDEDDETILPRSLLESLQQEQSQQTDEQKQDLDFQRLRHEAYKEKTREYKKAYMRAYRKRNRAKLNEYNRLYNANGRRARLNSSSIKNEPTTMMHAQQLTDHTVGSPASSSSSSSSSSSGAAHQLVPPLAASFLSSPSAALPLLSPNSFYAHMTPQPLHQQHQQHHQQPAISYDAEAAMRLAAATFLRAFVKTEPMTSTEDVSGTESYEIECNRKLRPRLLRKNVK